ncbi:MFS transporter [Devosia sp. H5989]|nr:MFS transporter [Devosia sp. H5989]
MDFRLIWLALGSFAVGTGAFVIASLLPAIAGETGVSMSQAGTLVLSFAIAYAIGAPVLSTLTGGLSRRPVLVGSILVFAAANIGASFSPNFEGLLLARIVMAAASGLFASAAQGTAVTLSTPETRTRAISVIVGGTTLSVALGAPIGALIANTMSWRGAFMAVGLVALFVAIALRAMLPAGLPGTKLPLRERLMVAFRPGIGSALLVTIFAIAAAFTVFTYIASLSSAIGLSLTFMPLVLLAFGLGAAIGNYASGQLADKFGAALTVRWVIILSSLTLVVFSGVAYLVPSPLAGWILLALMVPWGIIGWGFPPAQSSRLVSLAPEAAPISLSLNASAIYVGVALGSVIGGADMALASAKDLGWVGAILGVVALAIHLYATREPQRLSAVRMG